MLRRHLDVIRLCKLTWHNHVGFGSLQLCRFFRNSPSRGANRSWTEEDLRKVKDLHARGFKYEAIAEQLGRSKPSVKGSINRLRYNKQLDVQAPHTVPRRNHAWTEHDDFVLKTLYREGKTSQEIANIFQRTEYSIRGRRRTLGLTTNRVDPRPRPPRRSQADYERALELRAAGNTGRAIAEIMNIPYTTIKHWMAKRQKRPGGISAEEVQKVRDMRDRGDSIATICAALPNHTYSTVSGLASRLIRKGSIATKVKSWSEEEKQKVIDLRTAGSSYKTVATQIPGRSESAVRHVWRQRRESRA